MSHVCPRLPDVCSNALISGKVFAALKTEGEGKKYEDSGCKPRYRDPIAGEKANLAPQPTMFGMVRSLMRLAVADASVAAVFQEWQGAADSSKDVILKRLEGKRSILFSTFNTEVKVQKVFPEKLINGMYPVPVELLSGPFKGTVGWVPVTVVSPVLGKPAKVAAGEAERRKAENQKTIDRRKKRSQRVVARNDSPSEPTTKPEKATEPSGHQEQLQLQL